MPCSQSSYKPDVAQAAQSDEEVPMKYNRIDLRSQTSRVSSLQWLTAQNNEEIKISNDAVTPIKTMFCADVEKWKVAIQKEYDA